MKMAAAMMIASTIQEVGEKELMGVGDGISELRDDICVRLGIIKELK